MSKKVMIVAEFELEVPEDWSESEYQQLWDHVRPSMWYGGAVWEDTTVRVVEQTVTTLTDG